MLPSRGNAFGCLIAFLVRALPNTDLEYRVRRFRLKADRLRSRKGQRSPLWSVLSITVMLTCLSGGGPRLTFNESGVRSRMSGRSGFARSKVRGLSVKGLRYTVKAALLKAGFPGSRYSLSNRDFAYLVVLLVALQPSRLVPFRKLRGSLSFCPHRFCHEPVWQNVERAGRGRGQSDMSACSRRYGAG